MTANAKPLSRRKFLALAGLTGTGLSLAACAPTRASQPTPTSLAAMALEMTANAPTPRTSLGHCT